MKRTPIIVLATLVLAILAAALLPRPTQAAPIRQQAKTITQPDGSSLTILLKGDEWCHWISDLDGNLLVLAEDGFYRKATKLQLQEHQEALQRGAELRAQANQRRFDRLKARAADNDSVVSDSTTNDSIGSDDIDSDSIASHFSFPASGKVRGIVILVEFPDLPFTCISDSDSLRMEFQDMMMKDGYDYAINKKYKHQGSAHDYFYQNSDGIFDPQFDVYGPVCVKDSMYYYGHNVSGSDAHPADMIVDACQILDSLGVDFTQYDNNDDGVIDFVFAFYAGQGENAYGGANTIWPHAWDVVSGGFPRVFLDGKQLCDYACTCELYGQYRDGVGTFCHEFTHVLGLPDLYDVNYSSASCTPGAFDVLDEGCYNLNGYCPSGLSSYERYELGWLRPTLLQADSLECDTLTDFGTTNKAFIVPVDSLDDPRDGEYYLFENRQQMGWDTYIPGHGMLVWHIDYWSGRWARNIVNTSSAHNFVDLVEADGKKKSGSSYTQTASTPFPGSGNHTEFTGKTSPAFAGWTYPGSSKGTLTNQLNKPITNIQELPTEADSTISIITFDFMDPDFFASIRDIRVDTPLEGNGASRIIWRNGQAVILTSEGKEYNLQGQQK